MANSFHLANLSEEEKEKVSKVEKEIGKVLIVWEKKDDNKLPPL